MHILPEITDGVSLMFFSAGWLPHTAAREWESVFLKERCWTVSAQGGEISQHRHGGRRRFLDPLQCDLSFDYLLCIMTVEERVVAIRGRSCIENQVPKYDRSNE